MKRTRTILAAIFLVGRLPSADGFGFFPPSSSSSSSSSSSRRGIVLAECETIPGDEDEGATGIIASSTTPTTTTKTTMTALLSRRRILSRAIPSSAGAAVAVAVAVAACRPPIASARVVSVPTATTTMTSLPSDAASADASSSSSTSSPSFAERRDELLRAISSESNDDVVVNAIEGLLPFGPLRSSSSSSDASSYESALDGTWKLLWYNKSDFSPLLKLPYPFRPDSYQYFGSDAEREVGPGRAAQGLVGGVVGLVFGKDAELWLSSGVSTSSDENAGGMSNLVILPPFRLQLGTMPGMMGGKKGGGGGEKRTIVESDSDSDFRKVNARDDEAQMAPRNEYEQLYVEDYGSGSLRVSVIARGDPVIVGDMFVHQKL